MRDEGDSQSNSKRNYFVIRDIFHFLIQHVCGSVDVFLGVIWAASCIYGATRVIRLKLPKMS